MCKHPVFEVQILRIGMGACTVPKAVDNVVVCAAVI